MMAQTFEDFLLSTTTYEKSATTRDAAVDSPKFEGRRGPDGGKITWLKNLRSSKVSYSWPLRNSGR